MVRCVNRSSHAARTDGVRLVDNRQHVADNRLSGTQTSKMLPMNEHSLPEEMARIGRSIRVVRKRRRFTQAALAERAGIATRTLRTLEQGGDVQWSTLLRVLRALGVDTAATVMPTSLPSPLALADAARRSSR